MLIDMHVHTNEISLCASENIEKVIELYSAKGYDGIVITNHLSEWTIRNIGEEKWESFIERFISVVNKGKSYAEKYGMKVFFGCELRFSGDENDYLLYGLFDELLKNTPDILSLGIKRLKRLADEKGFLVYQAHPFRNGMKITEPKYLHGIEVWNGHTGHNSRNYIARLWADLHDLSAVSGSDFHEVGGEATGGMLFFDEINNEEDLTRALLANNFRLISSTDGGFERYR